MLVVEIYKGKKNVLFVLLSAVNSGVLQRRTGRVQVTYLKFFFFFFFRKSKPTYEGL